MKKATLTYGNKTHEMDIIEGVEGNPGIDISGLRNNTGLVTYDEGYQNTSNCKSAITYVDGEKGILRHRGIPIEEIAEHASFTETAYLLLYGDLPNHEQLQNFSNLLTKNSLINEEMIHLFNGIPPHAHPMAILSTAVNALSIYDTNIQTDDFDPVNYDLVCASLISKIRTIAAYSYKNSLGEPFVYPRHNLKYTENLLHMMFDSPVNPYELKPEIVKALSLLLILHIDHEQNCSTSTIRLVGSSKVNLYSSICAGICALWGPLHGGANQEAIETLERIERERIPIKKVIERAKAKDKNKRMKLFGFGHRVYKTYDPRARILKRMNDFVLKKLDKTEPLIEIALELEEAALNDDYFIEKNLYPNVDFYSGILYKSIGIPKEMFTVMFAIGRLPGWIAQWKEMHDTVPLKIGRPRQIYIGEKARSWIPIDER